MTPEDQKRATEVADQLLPLVVDHWSPAGTETVRVWRQAGEVGMVLESVLIAADKRDIDLPADWVKAAGESLAIPGMCPPGTDLDRLQRIVDNRVSAAPT